MPLELTLSVKKMLAMQKPGAEALGQRFQGVRRRGGWSTGVQRWGNSPGALAAQDVL